VRLGMPIATTSQSKAPSQSLRQCYRLHQGKEGDDKRRLVEGLTRGNLLHSDDYRGLLVFGTDFQVLYVGLDFLSTGASLAGHGGAAGLPNSGALGASIRPHTKRTSCKVTKLLHFQCASRMEFSCEVFVHAVASS
jgi:hypothetical protein